MTDRKICPFMSRPVSGFIGFKEVVCLREKCMAWVEGIKGQNTMRVPGLEEPVVLNEIEILAHCKLIG